MIRLHAAIASLTCRRSSAVGSPVNGTVNLNSGQITFTPAPDYNGPASFSYTVTDNNGLSATKTATVTIVGQNDAPVALAIAQDANEDGPSVTLTANYSDVDLGDTHTFSVDTTGTLGTVRLMEATRPLSLARLTSSQGWFEVPCA